MGLLGGGRRQILIRHAKRQGSRGAAPLLSLAAAAIFVTAAVALTVANPAPTHAGTSMLGIDVKPNSNSPASVGNLETCASYDEGDQFEIDVIVNNVESLRSWELRLDYDADVVTLLSADYNHFLVSTPPGGQVFPSLFDQESKGRYFLAASEFRAAPDSGSGILARITLEAAGNGTSPIRIVDNPKLLGPRLSQPSGDAIGDSNNDLIWDDSVIDAEIRVGSSCSGAPVVTPIPSPKPGTPTPRPAGSGTPAPSPQTGDGGGDDDGDSETTSRPVAVNPGGSSGEDDGDPASAGGDGGSSDPGDGSGAGGGSEGSVEDGANGDDPGDGSAGLPRVRTPGEGSNSTTWVLMIIGVVAVALVASGGGLYALSKRERF